MAARARYATQAFTVNGVAVQVVPNASVTLYEPGTTTPLAKTIYAGVTGATTKPNPFTADASGTIDFSLVAAQRVKIVTSGLSGGSPVGLTADYEPVLHDPADIIAMNPGYRVDLDKGLRAYSDVAGTPAVEARNTVAGGIIERYRDETDATVALWTKTGIFSGAQTAGLNLQPPGIALGNGLSGQRITLLTYFEGSTLAELGGGLNGRDFIQIQSTLNARGYYGDNSAGSFFLVMDQPNTNSGGRAVEAQVIRFVGTTAGGTLMAIEAGTHSTVAGVGGIKEIDNVGVFINANTAAHGSVGAPVPQSAGLLVMSDLDGWRNSILCLGTGSVTRNPLFRVAGGFHTDDVAGDVSAFNHLYSTQGFPGAIRVGMVNHQLAISAAAPGQTWAGMHYDFGQAALVLGAVTQGTGVRPILLQTLMGNIAMFHNTSAQFGAGMGVLALGNAGAVPTTNPTGGGVLYSQAGSLRWRGSSGTVTTIAPA